MNFEQKPKHRNLISVLICEIFLGKKGKNTKKDHKIIQHNKLSF